MLIADVRMRFVARRLDLTKLPHMRGSAFDFSREDVTTAGGVGFDEYTGVGRHPCSGWKWICFFFLLSVRVPGEA